jgi:hypothetical protein
MRGVGMVRSMNRIGGTVVGLLFVTWLLSLPSPGPAQDYQRFFGVVVQADPDGHTVLVMDTRSGRKLQMRVTDLTLIKEGDQYKKLPDLTSGTPVTVLFEESGGELTALTIMIEPPEG